MPIRTAAAVGAGEVYQSGVNAGMDPDEAARAAAAWGTTSATIFGPAANKAAGIAGNTAANLGGSSGARWTLGQVAQHPINKGVGELRRLYEDQVLP